MIPDIEPLFPLDLNNIANAQINDPFCMPLIHSPTFNIKQQFTYDYILRKNQKRVC